MVSARKRNRQEMEAEVAEIPSEPTLLHRIRNTWEFANLAQYVYTFGSAVKIDENLDIEDLEMECLKSQSTVLSEIGLALLKFVSSHRGLTPEIFDEYTRRQYVAKAPHRNPYGEEEEPAKFATFDIFTKIRVLQQLSQWTFGNPERIREKMPEQKDNEQTIWRIEAFGWDSDDRTYFVLDDNRLYRRTDPPPPPPPASKPKKNSKKAKAALRASKRRRVSAAVESDAEPTEDFVQDNQEPNANEDTFEGMKWECLAVTLDEFNSFLSSIGKSKDPNEKQLRKKIADDVLPLLEKQEESRQRKAAQKEKELLNLEKLATAKRSSRIAGRQEHLRQEEEARETEKKKQTELALAKKEQERWLKLEKERESRMMTREQRLKEREARRVLHEEELANLSEDNKKIENGSGRLSERHLKAEIEKKKKALEELAEEDDWIFDCICGAYGKIDDGTHSIACDKCNIWQHSKCVGVSQAAAERDNFHFICQTCTRRADDLLKSKTQPPIKIKIQRPGSSSSLASKQNTPSNIEPKAPTGTFQDPGDGQHSPQKIINKPSTPGLPPIGIFRPSLGNSPSLPGQSKSFSVASITGSAQRNGSSPSASSIKTGGISSPRGNNPYILAPPTQGSSFTKQSPPMPKTGLFQAHQSHQPQVQPQNSGTTNGASAYPPSPTKSESNGQLPALSQNSRQPVFPSPMNGSRPSSTGHGFGAPPTQQATTYQHERSNHTNQRRTSINISSPVIGAPGLTPMSKPSMSFPTNGSPVPNLTPSAQSNRLSPTHHSSSPSASQQIDPEEDSGHASALPPASTGISPTKHSPPTPRPTSANYNLGLAPVTPSVLPPVAPLSPSPQPQNLTPPIKHSEPERHLANGPDSSQ